MGAPITLMYPNQWLNEGQDHQFAAIPLYDDKGVLLASVADLWLTLYDAEAPEDEVINSLDHVSIKNTARYSFTGGQFKLTLNKDDLAITTQTGGYTRRQALIEYAFGTGGTKSGTELIEFVIRHRARYPYVAP